MSDRDYPPLSVTKDGILPQLEAAAKTNSPDSRKLVLRGDFVINSRSDRKGSSGVSPQDGSVSAISTVLEPHGIDRYFAHYLFRSGAFQEEYYRFGSGIVADLWSTRFSAMKQILMPVPPEEEQLAISSFLDRETAKIDALIAKQEQLIATLREDRAATITQAVTKGLDPNVEMIASPLKWADSVPSTWAVRKLRQVATMKTGHTPSRSHPEYWVDTTIPWFTLADVWQLRSGRQKYLGETSSMISETGLRNSAAELLPAGTVILSRTASVGFSGIMQRETATSQDFWNWVCGPDLEPEYLLYVLRAMKPFFDSLMMGSTHQTIYQADAAAISIPLPPITVQTEIVDHLDSRTTQIDILIDKSTQMITTLREYRSALITAAVTGKIDVREAV
ncbi:restriction endonuclease subunit S [Gordonia shandongensis]|uniref:restriction endonuclease subunit S n=1 Tax=Gordonia shandongensis TaxID=376351 RepID=UPI0012EC03EF|nr:restriction endonuclease subunit S [Gordonia shandongensis]